MLFGKGSVHFDQQKEAEKREVCSLCKSVHHSCLGLAGTIHIYKYTVYTVSLKGKSPNTQCIYTVLVNPTHA